MSNGFDQKSRRRRIQTSQRHEKLAIEKSRHHNVGLFVEFLSTRPTHFFTLICLLVIQKIEGRSESVCQEY